LAPKIGIGQRMRQCALSKCSLSCMRFFSLG